MSALTGPKLRVAICGGGIGGLSLACALSRDREIAVDVYERSTDFNPEVGAGISIGSRNKPFLSELGLVEDLAAISRRSGSVFSINKADTSELQTIIEGENDETSMVYRAEFHGILHRRIPKHVGMLNNKTLVSYVDSGDAGSPVRLEFADGSTATCDVLVGADGVKSAVRAAMLEDLAQRTQDVGKSTKLREGISPRFSGVTSYRTVVPKEKSTLPADSSVWTAAAKIYTGGGRALVTYPMSQGNKLNTALYTFDHSKEDSIHPQPWAEQVRGDELVSLLDGWAQEPRDIIAGFKGLDTKKWVVNTVGPLEDWSAGRVTLLGDAAHAMTPFQGAGAGQAMEDAWALSTLLAHPRVTRDTVQQALRVYSDVRRPIATAFQESSSSAGKLMTNGTLSPDELKAQFWVSGQSVWGRPSAEADVQQAVEMLEKTIAA
ncbi:salicylate hydroxylase [Peniophora sp. CONT]|nr:salicylate hydroxylase [Peniophora sp. CONT]